MPEYRYWATHVVTGAVLADWIPLGVASFSRTLGEAGELSATLDLHQDPARNAGMLAALEPRRTMLWVAQDRVPVWGGVVWDWPHSSVLSGQLPVRARTVESLLARREIRGDLVFAGADVFDVARSLVTAGTAAKGDSSRIAGLELPTDLAGATTSVTYPGAESQDVLAALQALAAAENFEFTFDVGLGGAAGADPAVYLRLGRPRLGQGLDPANSPVIQFPGNVLDYAYPRTGSASANDVRATATSGAGSGTQEGWASGAGRGVDLADLALGFPLLEDTVQVSAGTVTFQEQVDTYADTVVAQRTGAATVPTVTLGGGAVPPLWELSLGSHYWFVATSPLHPSPGGGAPGLATLVRIVGWSAQPPGDGREESVTLVLGEAEAA